MTKRSDRQDGRPSFQFYPGDWWRDTGVRIYSLAARGLWMDMLCIMFDASRRGYLLANGKQMSSTMLAARVGVSDVEVTALIAELEDAGVFSRLKDGTIYNRRMVRDADISAKRSEAGKVGGHAKADKQKSGKRLAKGWQMAEEEEAVEDEVEVAGEEEPVTATSNRTPQPPIQEHDAVAVLSGYWKLKGGRPTQRMREAFNVGLKAGLPLDRAKIIIDAVDADIEPWKLERRLLDYYRELQEDGNARRF